MNIMQNDIYSYFIFTLEAQVNMSTYLNMSSIDELPKIYFIIH